MINSNYSTTEILQGLNYTQEFKHLVGDIFLLSTMNVLLTFKIKSLLKNNHTLQQQSQLLLSVKKNEKRTKNNERRTKNKVLRTKFNEARLTDKKTNLRGQTLGSLIIVPRGRRTACN